MNEPNPSSKLRYRRWYQFRLRTMLIGVALLSIPCGYVGWQARIVTHRAAERRWLEQQGANFVDDGWADDAIYNEERRPSALRELLGDHAIGGIVCVDDVQKERAAKAFPEADIVAPFDFGRTGIGPVTLPAEQ